MATAINSPGLGRASSWLLDHWIALAAGTWLVSGLLYLNLPPSGDQFNHAYMGWRVLQGDAPYRDFIDPNWPGTIWLHAIATSVFGVHIWSWRAADFLMFALSAVFLVDLVRRADGSDCGKYCLLLAPLIYIGLSDWIAGQHDMSAAHLLVVALWLHVRAYEQLNWRWQIGTGVFVAAAMLCKPTVGIIAAILPLHAIWIRAPGRTVFAHTLTLSIAALATLAASMAIVIALGTPLTDLVDAIYTYNVAIRFRSNDPIQHVGADSRFAVRTALMGLWEAMRLDRAGRWVIAGLLCLPAFIGWIQSRHHGPATSALLALLFTGVLSYIIQGRGWGYHLSPSVPALIGGLTASISRAASNRRRARVTWDRRLWLGYLVIASLWIAQRLATNYYSLPIALAAGDYAIHLARFDAGDGLVVSDVVDFSHRVEVSDRSDCVFVIGTISSINYLSLRRQPTRFYYFPVISNMREPMPLARRWIDLWESDLTRTNCRYLLINETISRDWLPGSARAASALRTLLLDYRLVGALGATRSMLIYERAQSDK